MKLEKPLEEILILRSKLSFSGFVAKNVKNKKQVQCTNARA